MSPSALSNLQVDARGETGYQRPRILIRTSDEKDLFRVVVLFKQHLYA